MPARNDEPHPQSQSWLTKLLLIAIRLYQVFISPLLGPCCRFEPSCSRYTMSCIENQGPLRGIWLGVRRILRCHPWSSGGYDPAPVGAPNTGDE